MKQSQRFTVRISATTPKVSDAVLANFLDDLAEVYRCKETGNLAMSNSLHFLAKAVRRKIVQPVDDEGDSRELSRSRQPQKERVKQSVSVGSELLAKLNLEEVKTFLMDPLKSKKELLDLAVARFSMPTSQLKRLRLEEVRESIASALHHEHSIDIINNESRKDGASRNS